MFRVHARPGYLEDVFNFLHLGKAPQGMNVAQSRSLAHKAFKTVARNLYYLDEILRRCGHPTEVEQLIQEAHYVVLGGTFLSDRDNSRYPLFKTYGGSPYLRVASRS